FLLLFAKCNQIDASKEISCHLVIVMINSFQSTWTVPYCLKPELWSEMSGCAMPHCMHAQQTDHPRQESVRLGVIAGTCLSCAFICFCTLTYCSCPELLAKIFFCHPSSFLGSTCRSFMNGFDATEALRRMWEDSVGPGARQPICALTAAHIDDFDRSQLMKFKDAGLDVMESKPCNIPRLFKVVDDVSPVFSDLSIQNASHGSSLANE
ncbi:hypothetical protein THAOC_01482, partial [Thalassiosira oceanica]